MMRRSLSLLCTVALAFFTLGAGTLHAQATWGPSSTMGTGVGASGSDTLTCPSGKYAIGIHVWTGGYVNGFRLECASLGPNGEHQSPELLGSLGGGGGNVVQRRCPSGKVMVGFQGRAGWWIDRVQVACKTWNRAGGGTQGSTTWTSSAGGTGGQPYGPISCPGQYAIYRVHGFDHVHLVHGWLVYGYDFSCKAAA